MQFSKVKIFNIDSGRSIEYSPKLEVVSRIVRDGGLILSIYDGLEIEIAECIFTEITSACIVFTGIQDFRRRNEAVVRVYLYTGE